MQYLKFTIAALACLLLPVTAASAVDLSKVLVNDDGAPLCLAQPKEGTECPADKVATLGRIMRTALYTSYADEQNLDGESKYKRAELAQAITGASKEIKFKADDLALIKKLIAKLYSPLVVWQAWRELDPAQ